MKVAEAIETLRKALDKDKEYRFSWQSSIAMAFVDEFDRRIKIDKSINDKIASLNINEIANKAADKFLKVLVL